MSIKVDKKYLISLVLIIAAVFICCKIVRVSNTEMIIIDNLNDENINELYPENFNEYVYQSRGVVRLEILTNFINTFESELITNEIHVKFISLSNNNNDYKINDNCKYITNEKIVMKCHYDSSNNDEYYNEALIKALIDLEMYINSETSYVAFNEIDEKNFQEIMVSHGQEVFNQLSVVKKTMISNRNYYTFEIIVEYPEKNKANHRDLFLDKISDNSEIIEYNEYCSPLEILASFFNNSCSVVPHEELEKYEKDESNKNLNKLIDSINIVYSNFIN